jgi:crossover junction endodeoxyribonuclease RusA
MISLTLPLPPTINHYYGQRPRGGRYIKPAGLVFRQQVAEIVAMAGHRLLEGRVSLFAAIHPADRRRQDIDNRAKSLQDALTHAGVWLDDEQIDDLHLVRRSVIKGGRVLVVITEIAGSA